jgi:DnaJ-class molecular chaperone
MQGKENKQRKESFTSKTILGEFETKTKKVSIEPGMKHGQKIVFSGEANEEPGMEPGDVIFVVVCKPHETFKRNGNDLFTDVSYAASIL